MGTQGAALSSTFATHDVIDRVRELESCVRHVEKRLFSSLSRGSLRISSARRVVACVRELVHRVSLLDERVSWLMKCARRLDEAVS